MPEPRDDARRYLQPNPTLSHQPNELICERYAVRARSMPTYALVSHSGDVARKVNVASVYQRRAVGSA